MNEETRRRLEALIDAYKEVGNPPEAAERLALQRLSAERSGGLPPSAQGSARRRTWIRRDWPGSWAATACVGGATLVTFALLTATGALIGWGIGARLDALLWIWVPLAAGAVVGTLAPRQPSRNTLRAIGVLALPTLALYGLWNLGLRYPYPWSSVVYFWSVHVVLWALFGPAAAGIVARVAAWRRKRPVAG